MAECGMPDSVRRFSSDNLTHHDLNRRLVKHFTIGLPVPPANASFPPLLKLMKKSLLLLLLGIVAALQPGRAGDLTGVINFKGTAPAERELTPIKDDPNCSAMYPGALPKTKFYVVGAGGELADVVVSLQGISGKSTGASAAPATMDQKGALYSPQIVAIQTGQKLIVKNSDPVVHNIHTKPAANPESNQVQMNGGPDLTYTFDKPEMLDRKSTRLN